MLCGRDFLLLANLVLLVTELVCGSSGVGMVINCHEPGRVRRIEGKSVRLRVAKD